MARDVGPRYGLRKQDRPDYFEASFDEQEEPTATAAKDQADLVAHMPIPKKRVIAESLTPAAPEQKKQQLGVSAGERRLSTCAAAMKQKEQSKSQTSASKEVDCKIPPRTLKDFIEDDGWDWADDEYRPSSASTISSRPIRPKPRKSDERFFVQAEVVPLQAPTIKVPIGTSTPASLPMTRPTWAVAPPLTAPPPRPLATAPVPPTVLPVPAVPGKISACLSQIQPPSLSIAKSDFRKSIDEVLPALKSGQNDRAVQLIESLSAVVTYDMQLRRNFEDASIADKQVISDLHSRIQALEEHIKEKDLELETQISTWTEESKSKEAAYKRLRQEFDAGKKRVISQKRKISALAKDKQDASDKTREAEARLEAYKLLAEEDKKRLQAVIKEKEADLAYWTKM